MPVRNISLENLAILDNCLDVCLEGGGEEGRTTRIESVTIQVSAVFDSASACRVGYLVRESK